jgi:hypothetical protein
MGLPRVAFAVTALAIAGVAACGGSPAPNNSGNDAGAVVPAAFRNQLDAAAASWRATKPGCSTYSYVRFWRSVFGTGGETSVEISNDVPSRRRYVAEPWNWPDGGAPVTWEETGATIGSHTGGGGAPAVYPALTVEELFAECDMVLAKDLDESELQLTAWTSGVLSMCTSRQKYCSDDCTSGIMLRSFACAPLGAP